MKEEKRKGGRKTQSKRKKKQDNGKIYYKCLMTYILPSIGNKEGANRPK